VQLRWLDVYRVVGNRRTRFSQVDDFWKLLLDEVRIHVPQSFQNPTDGIFREVG
jgi:hypothetical protein